MIGKAICGASLEIRSAKWAGLASGLELPGTIIAYALTLGAPVDDRIASVQSESLAAAYTLDATASEAVELIADCLEGDIWAAFDPGGYERTARFSPGYCDWPLEAQEPVFEFLHPEQIGIRLTSSYGMLPAKSITAVFLAAKAFPLTRPCRQCDERDCRYRRV